MNPAIVMAGCALVAMWIMSTGPVHPRNLKWGWRLGSGLFIALCGVAYYVGSILYIVSQRA